MAAARTYFSIFVEMEDIFKVILSDWLTLRDQINMDGALSGIQRNLLHSVMRRVPMRQPYLDKVECWWKHHKHILRWMANRNFHKTTGLWCFHDRIWPILYGNRDAIYTPILQNLQMMRFENFNPGFNINELSICHHLKELQMYNLDGHESNPITDKICPELERLYLQGCKLSANVLRGIASCTRLTSVSYFHNEYLPFASFTPKEQAAILPYFQRLTSFSVVAHVNNVLASHFPPGPVHLTALSVDNVHKSESNTQNLLDFLANCESVVDLSISRCRFNFATVLKVIRERCREVQRLHLNHCRWLRVDHEEHDVDVVNPSERLTHLLISTALPMFDQDLDALLRLCGQFVTDLQVSFCARLKPTAYAIIRNRVPLLESLLVEYSEEDGYFNSEHMAEIQRVFAQLPRLRVNKWDVWLTEQMKATHQHQCTVMLDKCL